MPDEPFAVAVPQLPWRQRSWAFLLSLLTFATLLIHGYHPLAEDGGIYAAGIFLKLDPTLFPHTADFVRAPMHYSFFASVMAAASRATHLPPMWVLLAAYLGSTWLMLFAARQILRRCGFGDSAQLAGVGLLTAWRTLPIAGTSLMLMDPYTTARSFSTPLSLLATAYVLEALDSSSNIREKRIVLLQCSACLLIAMALHLLMAAYALIFIIILLAAASRRAMMNVSALAVCGLLVATLLQVFAPPESPATVVAAITRYYWFLSQWHWYELTGLLGPTVILGLIRTSKKTDRSRTLAVLCSASLTFGFVSFTIALFFAHEGASTHLVARLQPLRVYLLLYALMTILLGAAFLDFATTQAGKFRKKNLRIAMMSAPLACIVISAFTMYYVQRQTYPASSHLELPWIDTTNPWSHAFLWARDNTSNDALFAMDAHYISAPSEDAQVFRAIALRDTLPDYSKDGGAASITSSLADRWQQGMTAQLHLEEADDSKRKSQLAPYGVSWLILQSKSATNLPCLYDNHVVKICRLSTSN